MLHDAVLHDAIFLETRKATMTTEKAGLRGGVRLWHSSGLSTFSRNELFIGS